MLRGHPVGASQRRTLEGPSSAVSFARDVLAIARDGLKARGLGEELYLAPLEEIAASGQTQADRLLALYHGAWRGDARQALLHAEV